MNNNCLALKSHRNQYEILNNETSSQPRVRDSCVLKRRKRESVERTATRSSDLFITVSVSLLVRSQRGRSTFLSLSRVWNTVKPWSLNGQDPLLAIKPLHNIGTPGLPLLPRGSTLNRLLLFVRPNRDRWSVTASLFFPWNGPSPRQPNGSKL